MPIDLSRDTIFVTLAGSHAHGTARSDSDVDLRGVCVAPLELRLSLREHFEQAEGLLDGALWQSVEPRIVAHPTAAAGLSVKVESVIYDVAKFLSLCASSNPNALEILFADERDWVFETPSWRRIHAERQRFLSKKVQQTYLGYALAQLKRIKSHRAWLLDPPQRKPAREDFGLPAVESTLSRDDQHRIERSIADKMRGYGLDNLDMPKPLRIALEERMREFWADAMQSTPDATDEGLRTTAIASLQLPSEVINALSAERRYRAAMKHWEAYAQWKSERNPARAALEARHGYDTKHAAHLVRLMRMGLELLQRGALRVRRDDAAELTAIRDGALTYDALMAMATELQQAMQEASAASTLPADVDHTFVEGLAFELMTGSAL